MNLEQAKQEIIGSVVSTGNGSLDATADALLARIAAFFGELASDESFCGLSIDEARDDAGKLQSLKLVACDLVGDEPCRREGKFMLAPAPAKMVLVQ